MSDKSKYDVNLNTGSLLGVLFVGLKLTGVINWPWLWVLSPFWIPVALLIVILVIAVILKAAIDPGDRS